MYLFIYVVDNLHFIEKQGHKYICTYMYQCLIMTYLNETRVCKMRARNGRKSLSDNRMLSYPSLQYVLYVHTYVHKCTARVGIINA